MKISIELDASEIRQAIIAYVNDKFPDFHVATMDSFAGLATFQRTLTIKPRES